MSHRLRMIASDLDGTLLLGGAQELCPETCGLVQRILDRGIFFMPASGRQYANLRRLFAPVADRLVYLCENGCLGMYRGEMLFRETMDRELGDEIIRTILDREGCEVLISGVNTSYIQSGEDHFYHHMKDVVRNNCTLVDDIFSVSEPYFKISLFEERGLSDTAWWKKKFGDRCTVETGGEQWLDIMPKGVHKGSAMKKILSRLGIDPADVIAFGDNDNDREMMAMAGCPIAVDSAKEEIRAMSRYTTDTVENALRRILDGDGYFW